MEDDKNWTEKVKEAAKTGIDSTKKAIQAGIDGVSDPEFHRKVRETSETVAQKTVDGAVFVGQKTKEIFKKG